MYVYVFIVAITSKAIEVTKIFHNLATECLIHTIVDLMKACLIFDCKTSFNKFWLP
jgi:hypothetical protein